MSRPHATGALLHAWLTTDPDQLLLLAAHPDAQVRQAAATNSHATDEVQVVAALSR